MATMREINEARANRMQSGLYGTPRTPEQSMRSYGAMSDADARLRDNEAADLRRQSLISQIPTARSSAPSAMATQAAAPAASSTYPDETARAMRAGPRGISPTSPQATRQREVPGATGVTRYDNVAGLNSPLYTNIPGASAMEQMRGGTVSTVGGESVQDMMARAERMRQLREGNTALRDSNSFNQGVGLTRQRDIDEIERGMLTSRSRTDRQAAAAGLTAQRRLASDERQTAARNEFEASQGVLQRQAATELANLQGQWGMAREGLNQAGAMQRAQLAANTTGSRSIVDGANRIFQEFIRQNDMAGAEKFRQEFLAEMAARRQEALGAEDDVPAFANGGIVPDYGVAPTSIQARPEVQEYRDYVAGAQRLGLPPVSFDQFTTMRAGAAQVAQAPRQVQPMTAMGFANGGPIPDPSDVSGKMVVDTNPMAPTDSIPAVIDGQMPAKLDSGEFVFPEDVVLFFGTDKLNKMIAAARQGAQPKE